MTNNNEVSFTNAANARKNAMNPQITAIDRAITGIINAGKASLELDYLIFPEVARMLADGGYKVTIYINDDLTGKTVISSVLAKGDEDGDLIVNAYCKELVTEFVARAASRSESLSDYILD
ncbi:MAG: hypothetical protein K6D97_05530 [Clostridia bacterium]|nr:hypothetical protein [Clostridia bacterium]